MLLGPRGLGRPPTIAAFAHSAPLRGEINAQCVPGLWVKVTNMANFKDYEKSPLMPDILPIIPKDGKLSPRSKLTPERIGKIPGIWTDDGWIGFPNWTRHRNRKPSILEAFDIQFGKATSRSSDCKLKSTQQSTSIAKIRRSSASSSESSAFSTQTVL